jgi:hypothetical protein
MVDFLSPLGKQPLRVGMVLIVFGLVLFLLSVFVFHSGSNVLVFPSTTIEATSSSAEITPLVTTHDPNIPANLVAIFTTNATSSVVHDRAWQTVNIWQKIGDAAPTLLATVGRVGEEADPSYIKVSPDHRYVAIGLEHKVDLLNTEDKTMRTVLTASDGIVSSLFSPDSAALLIAEGNTEFDSNAQASLVRIDLVSGKQTKSSLSSKDVFGDVGLIAWRPDNKVVYEPISYKDCASPLRVIDLNSGAITPSNASPYFILSKDGTLGIGSAKESISNACVQNEMCGPDVVASLANVIDPASGQTLAVVGRANEEFEPIAFSPDDTQVLYKTDARNSCSEPSNMKAYVQNIQSGSTPKSVSDPDALLNEWQGGKEMKVTYDSASFTTDLVYDGQIVVHSPNYDLTILAQYYR